MATHIKVSGRVQGVGFRFAAKQSALEHSLVGWVHNNMDGTVEMEVAGNQEKVDQFLADMKAGFNRFIRVENIKLETTDKTANDFDGFSIK